MGVPSLGPTQNRVQNPASSATATPAETPSTLTGTNRATPVAPRDTFEARPAETPAASPAPVVEEASTPVASDATELAEAATALNDPADLQARNGVPWISQLKPEGAAESYANGDFNCAPASFAMVARRAGFGEGMSDAELISDLASVGKTERGAGTSMNGALAMANRIGMPVDRSEVSFPGFNQEWMDGQLKAGKAVIANGALETPEGPSGHFIVVTGQDADGNYLVNDPLNPEHRKLSAEELGEFLARNPLHKGASIAVG